MKFFHQRSQVGGERKNMWLGASWVAAGLCAILTVGSAQAAPLGLNLNDFPDITSSFITVNYDSGSNTFTEDGFAETLATGPGSSENILDPSNPLNPGGLTLTANIDESGVLISGNLTVTGIIPTLGYTSGTLLTGNLTAFGFIDAGGDPLEFLFDVTGGDLQGIFGSAPAGQILTNSGFGGDFTVNFGSFNGTNDIAGTPEPSTILLFITGLGILGGCVARRQRARA